jgi:hypothetical protein
MRSAFSVQRQLGVLRFEFLSGVPILTLKRPTNAQSPKLSLTPNAELVEGKIKIGGKFIKSLDKFIKIGYQASEFDTQANEAMSYLLKNCFIVEEEKTKLDYSTFPLSRGEMTAPEKCTLTISENTVLVTWEYLANPWFSKGEDKLMVALHVEDDKKSYSQIQTNVAYREAGRASFPIPITDKEVHLWLFFHNSDNAVGESRKNISDSVYFRIQ